MASTPGIVAQDYQYGFHDEVEYREQTTRGFSRGSVEEISRDDVPGKVKLTFEKLGIPEAARNVDLEGN